MLLARLIEGLYPYQLDERICRKDISGISTDSRRVRSGNIFVALRGSRYDGADFVLEAVANGASVVVCDRQLGFGLEKDVCFLKVDDVESFLKEIVTRFYGLPSNKLKSIGITGTNGKTTVSYLIEAILKQDGRSCGVLGTVNYRIGAEIIPSEMTTPSFVDTQSLLAKMVASGVEYNVMEVSSHALVQGRVELINFNSAVFTNLTSDHLDYHKNRKDYFLAKARLFEGLKNDSVAVINVDDFYGRQLLSLSKGRNVTYGIDNEADVMALAIHLNIAGTEFQLVYGDRHETIQTRLVGIYNVYNILAAAAVCLNEGIDIDKIKRGIACVPIVPGRLEAVDCGQDFAIFIDYAHTQDALHNVLVALRNVTTAKIILVFGCGGDRDKSKRPLMGKVASKLADFTIITTDNPRNEDPITIINDITAGFERENYKIVVNRTEAIYEALNMASYGTIVLIAGKGHECYQVFNDKTIEFDERKIIREYFGCVNEKEEGADEV